MLNFNLIEKFIYISLEFGHFVYIFPFNFCSIINHEIFIVFNFQILCKYKHFSTNGFPDLRSFVLSESKNGDNYTYTTGIDAKDTFLFCNTEDSSVQIYNIYWRRKDGSSYHTNPLYVYTLRNILILNNYQEIECFDTESGDNIMSVGLYMQGSFCSFNS